MKMTELIMRLLLAILKRSGYEIRKLIEGHAADMPLNQYR